MGWISTSTSGRRWVCYSRFVSRIMLQNVKSVEMYREMPLAYSMESSLCSVINTLVIQYIQSCFLNKYFADDQEWISICFMQRFTLNDIFCYFDLIQLICCHRNVLCYRQQPSQRRSWRCPTSHAGLTSAAFSIRGTLNSQIIWWTTGRNTYWARKMRR